MRAFAKVVIGIMSLECFATAVAFAANGEWKLALYWMFACGINSVAYTF